MRRSYRIAGTVAATLAAAAAGVAATSGSATAAVVAKSKYQAAMKAAAAQNVHYVSTATEQGISLEVVGDTGKTSGSQLLEVQKGSITEELSVVLIGKTGYVRGNVSALENVLGLTAPQSNTYSARPRCSPSGWRRDRPGPADQRLAAWLSLDRGDNDPASFWTYVIAALRTVASGVGDSALALLQAPRPPPIETVLTALLNDLGALAGDVGLVLDDYHLVDARTCATRWCSCSTICRRSSTW